VEKDLGLILRTRHPDRVPATDSGETLAEIHAKPLLGCCGISTFSMNGMSNR
jgi:hypothetical protein